MIVIEMGNEDSLSTLTIMSLMYHKHLWSKLYNVFEEHYLYYYIYFSTWISFFPLLW